MVPEFKFINGLWQDGMGNFSIRELTPQEEAERRARYIAANSTKEKLDKFNNNNEVTNKESKK